MEQATTTRGVQASSVSAAASLLTNNGPSLAEGAQRDLDAALQLLAHRAQYITGASGAAIALRRDGKKDMLCRASTGSNAPELGALLSTEVGLSGESVRTKRPLRCDDTLSDARVNHEVCRQLGIASVVVMPVVNDDQVLGVFELFSGQANAFGERDLSAVQRLAEMVQTAVQLARAAEAIPAPEKVKAAAAGAGNQAVPGEFVADLVIDDRLGTESSIKIEDPAINAQEVSKGPIERVTEATVLSAAPGATPKKTLLWSAPVNVESDAPIAADIDQSSVPPVLRDLRKCVACGFPVSAGRMLCVECEEKKWKGQLRSRTSQPIPAVSSLTSWGGSAAAAPAMARVPAATNAAPLKMDAGAKIASTPAEDKFGFSAKPGAPASADTKIAGLKESVARETNLQDAPELILSAAAVPSQSWLASHKYVLIALVVIAAAAAAVFLFR